VDLFTATLRAAQPFRFMFAERQGRAESGFAGVAVVFVVGHGASPIDKKAFPEFSAFRKDCQLSLIVLAQSKEVFTVVLEAGPLYDSLNEFRAGYRV
jgi:hypothetical protein